LADHVERDGHGCDGVRRVDAVAFDQVQQHKPSPHGAKAKYREGERLFKIAQAQSLFVVKIAHSGTFIFLMQNSIE
jgi:hypothetical protein